MWYRVQRVHLGGERWHGRWSYVCQQPLADADQDAPSEWRPL